jgi:short-subunit dehydrogenase
MIAVITGASSGIGEATARAFVADGAQVVLTSEREQELMGVAASLQASGGKVTPLVVDFSKPDQVTGLIARIEAEVGPVDVLVNNAGLGLGARILEMKLDDLRFLFEVNFFALATLSREAFAVMAERKRGRIINISSGAGRLGLPGVGAYAASKGAVHNFTSALRIEGRACGIFVSEVMPVSVRTKFFDNVKGETYRPSGVVQTPEQVAQVILRCAKAARPKAEVLPYRLLRIPFVLDALLPGILDRFLSKDASQKHP